MKSIHAVVGILSSLSFLAGCNNSTSTPPGSYASGQSVYGGQVVTQAGINGQTTQTSACSQQAYNIIPRRDSIGAGQFQTCRINTNLTNNKSFTLNMRASVAVACFYGLSVQGNSYVPSEQKFCLSASQGSVSVQFMNPSTNYLVAVDQNLSPQFEACLMGKAACPSVSEGPL